MKNTKKLIKPNLEHTMTKRTVFFALAFIIFGSCTRFMKKEIKVYVENGKYGWYFVFIENAGGEFSADEPNAFDLTNENFAIIKLGDPAKYKLRIFDKYSKKELSKKMKLISYRGNYETFMCCKFYYPDPEKYPDEVFGKDVNDPESNIERDIARIGSSILDSIMKKQNLSW